MTRTLTVAQLTHALQEHRQPRLSRVLWTLGHERCRALLAETLQCEADGGMLTHDGTRRRTLGGVFFQLVRQHTTPAERAYVFAPERTKKHQGPSPALTTDALRGLVNTLPRGEATVTLTLRGRPDVQAIQTRPTYVAFRMQGTAPGSLPTGLPPVPSQAPITWLVVVACTQWNRVKDSLEAHADDTLVIEGYPVLASDGTHVLLAQSCASRWQQRAKTQAQQIDGPTAYERVVGEGPPPLG